MAVWMAWDKGVMEEKFPDEIDEDGDGLIFYLMPAGWDGDYNKRASKGRGVLCEMEKGMSGDEERSSLFIGHIGHGKI